MTHFTRIRATAAFILAAGLSASSAWGQSSSLYVTENVGPARPLRVATTPAREDSPLSEAIAGSSFTAVLPPQPQQFAVHDLITIIVREETTSDVEGTLDTEKKLDLKGELSDLPKFQLAKLLEGQLGANTFPNGTPKIGLKFDNKFEGDGQYDRKDTVTSRLTARVIDVKPNGTLVLEARKYLRSDDETMSLVLTGTCRVEDVTVDNTVLSTELYDLHLDKRHEGAIRNATKKGLLTKILDVIFNF